MIVRELLTKWKIVVDNKTLNQLDRQIRQTKKNFNDAGKSAIKFGRNMSLFVTTPILAVQGALVKAASDAEETTSKFNTVFASLQNESAATAKALSRDFGLSTVKAKEFLGTTGDLLTGFGFSQKAALDMSREVNELAVDLASFTNVQGGAERASAALTKALLGERESAKLLGISILEEDVKKRVQLLRAQGITFETERQAKAMATLQIAQEQSKNAIGDFARTQQSFANRSRILRNRLNDLSVSFGQILLPAATRTLNRVIGIVEAFNDLDPSTKKIILTLSTLAAAIGPVLIGLGVMAKAISLAKDGFQLARIALTKFSITGVLTAALMAAAFVAIILVLEDLLAFFQGRTSVTAVIVSEFNRAIDFLNEKFKDFSFGARVAISAILFPIRAVINGIQALGGALGALSVGNFSEAFNALKEGVTKTLLPDLKDLGSLLGFEQEERTFNLPGVGKVAPKPTGTEGVATVQPIAPAAASAPAPSGGNVSNITVNSPITVPPGTPPELVGDKVKEAAVEVFSEQMRNTRRTIQPQVAF